MLINIKNTIFIFCTTLIFLLINDVCSATQGYNRDKVDAKAWKYEPVSYSTVENELNNLYSLITKGTPNGKPINSLSMLGQSRQVWVWAKRPWIEVETEVQKAWFMKVIAQINYMRKLKKLLELAKYNKQLDLPENKKLIYKYKAAIEYFKKLIDKPDKVDRKSLLYMKRKRKEWLKQMAKKEKERLERLQYERKNGRR